MNKWQCKKRAAWWLFFSFYSRKIVVSCHRVKNRKFLWYNSVNAFALAGTVFFRSNRKGRNPKMACEAYRQSAENLKSYMQRQWSLVGGMAGTFREMEWVKSDTSQFDTCYSKSNCLLFGWRFLCYQLNTMKKRRFLLSIRRTGRPLFNVLCYGSLHPVRAAFTAALKFFYPPIDN